MAHDERQVPFANQIDLFAAPERRETYTYPLPDGDVTLTSCFFNKAVADSLFDTLRIKIQWQQDNIRLYGRAIDLPRLTAWYGDPGSSYIYSGIAMNPLPWTPELLFIKERIEEGSGVVFTSVLLNLYRNGNDGVHWHSDDEKELGLNPVIGSVSLGGTRTFQLRHLKRRELPKVEISLTHGSFLLMKGTTQHFWEHQLPKTRRAVKPRINLTFRVI